MSDDIRDMLQEAALRIFADNPEDLCGVLKGACFEDPGLPTISSSAHSHEMRLSRAHDCWRANGTPPVCRGEARARTSP